DVGRLGLVARRLLLDPQGDVRERYHESRKPDDDRVPEKPCHVRYSDRQHPYCNQMPQAETITSAANPLLKDVRRAIAHGGLTQHGCCVAETYHLLEEALRSGCEVPLLVVSESARATVESRVGRLPSTQMAVLADAEFQRLAATETSQGVM